MTVRTLAAAAIVAAGAALSLSCFSDRSSVNEPPSGDECSIPASAIGPNRAVVLIRNFAYFPDTLRVRPGTTVTWVNCEPAGTDAHTASAADDDWDSGTLGIGASYARRFDAAGADPYFCRPHPFMRGVVLVQ